MCMGCSPTTALRPGTAYRFTWPPQECAAASPTTPTYCERPAGLLVQLPGPNAIPARGSCPQQPRCSSFGETRTMAWECLTRIFCNLSPNIPVRIHLLSSSLNKNKATHGTSPNYPHHHRNNHSGPRRQGLAPLDRAGAHHEMEHRLRRLAYASRGKRPAGRRQLFLPYGSEGRELRI